MHKRRGVLVVLGLLVVLGGAGLAAKAFLYHPLPRPELADREQLLRWLVTRDLGQEPTELRKALVRRLEEEFGTGIDWEGTGSRLDATQKERVWSNVVVLMEPWFMDKVDHYYELKDGERGAYVDRLLDTLGVLRGVDSLRSVESQASAESESREGLLEVFFTRVARWKQEAEPKRGEQIGQFLAAMQARWFLRSIGLSPASS